MSTLWFIRAKRWSQNPPSLRRIKLIFGVIFACVLIVGVDKFIGLPDWMDMERSMPFAR